MPINVRSDDWRTYLKVLTSETLSSFFLVPKLGLGTQLYCQAKPGSHFRSQVQLGNELNNFRPIGRESAAPPSFGIFLQPEAFTAAPSRLLGHQERRWRAVPALQFSYLV